MKRRNNIPKIFQYSEYSIPYWNIPEYACK
nr:MAG TPA: hypothetical protein [Caudoviricetes sp.]DAV69814.1 MAG TPA: hypothetical protein [Caudoviricetes sp.]